MAHKNQYSGKSSEYKLISVLTEKGYNVSVPVLPIAYDLMVEKDNKCIKVQVKSTRTLKNNKPGCYQCVVSKSNEKRVTYSRMEVDVIAVHVSPEDMWFLIPIENLYQKTIILFTNQKKGKFDLYKENWNILDL